MGAAEVEVLDAVARRSRALTTRDPQALTGLLHPLFRWTSYRGQRFDRASYVDANTGGSLRWISQRVESADVAVDGDAAVVTGTVVDEVERGGEPEVHRLLVTMVWIRRDRRWVCLAGHAGPPAP